VCSRSAPAGLTPPLSRAVDRPVVLIAPPHADFTTVANLQDVVPSALVEPVARARALIAHDHAVATTRWPASLPERRSHEDIAQLLGQQTDRHELVRAAGYEVLAVVASHAVESGVLGQGGDEVWPVEKSSSGRGGLVGSARVTEQPPQARWQRKAVQERPAARWQ
jgi:hypothetical protein